MTTQLTTKQWYEILQDEKMTKELDLLIFQALYSFNGYKASASEIGKSLGYNSASPLNSEVGRYAKRILEYYDIEFTKRENGTNKYWTLFFDGWKEGELFIWKLRAELKNALEELNLIGGIVLPEEFPLVENEKLLEGTKSVISVNKYERNPKARRECINHWGCVCVVCGFDFEKVYGEIGKDFIHVHHLVPISKISTAYLVNPITDLCPVCPNCHAMLHKKGKEPFTVEELKKTIEINKK